MGNIGTPYFQPQFPQIPIQFVQPDQQLTDMSPQETNPTEIRFKGEPSFGNDFDPNAVTVRNDSEDSESSSQPNSQDGSVQTANTLGNPRGSVGTSVPSSLSESIARAESTPNVTEEKLRRILQEIFEEGKEARVAIGPSLSTLADLVTDGNQDEDDDATIDTCTFAENILRKVREEISEEDYTRLLYSRVEVIKKFDDWNSRSSSLSSIAEEGIDGTSPTFGRMIKMLSFLVPLLLQLTPYWRAGSEFYNSLTDDTKRLITRVHQLLEAIGQEIVFPAQVLIGNHAITINLCEVARPNQMCEWAKMSKAEEDPDPLVTTQREMCQEFLALTMRMVEDKDVTQSLSFIARLQAAIFI